MKPEKFPLSWPAGYPVTNNRQPSSFKVTFLKARDEMINEFKLLLGDTRSLVISCNMPHDTKGVLTGKSPLMYPNPGVAVYFTFNGEEKVIACDHWRHLHENIRAIGITVSALRSLERQKCTQILSRAMGDMKALPQNAGASNGAWWDVLCVKETDLISVIKERYNDLIKIYHPDKPTGNKDMFNMVTNAYQEARRAKGFK